jgi:YggT family protein
MIALINLLSSIVNFYIFLLLIYVILSWLILFGVVNGNNRVVYAVNNALHAITEPVLRPLRRWQRRLLPTWQVDLSPIILVLLLHFMLDLLRFDILPRLV